MEPSSRLTILGLSLLSLSDLYLEGVKARNMANRSASLTGILSVCHYAFTRILLLERKRLAYRRWFRKFRFVLGNATGTPGLLCVPLVDRCCPSTCTHDRLGRQACVVHVPVCVMLSTTIGDFILALSSLGTRVYPLNILYRDVYKKISIARIREWEYRHDIHTRSCFH